MAHDRWALKQAQMIWI